MRDILYLERDKDADIDTDTVQSAAISVYGVLVSNMTLITAISDRGTTIWTDRDAATVGKTSRCVAPKFDVHLLWQSSPLLLLDPIR